MAFVRWCVGFAFAGVVGLAASCSDTEGSADDSGDDGDCDLGSEGCDCTGGGGCDTGLMCLSGKCVDAGNSTDGSGSGVDSTASGSDASGGGTSAADATATTGITGGGSEATGNSDAGTSDSGGGTTDSGGVSTDSGGGTTDSGGVSTDSAGDTTESGSTTGGAMFCEPNAAVCDGQIATTCNSSGTAYEPGGQGCGPTEPCFKGFCQDGAVAIWPLDETTGTIAFDITPGAAHGTVEGGIWAAGQKDGGLQLDAAGERVDFGDVVNIGFQVSVVAWVYVEPSNEDRLVFATDDPDTNNGVWLEILASNEVQFCYADGNGARCERSLFTMPENTWCQIAGLSSGTPFIDIWACDNNRVTNFTGSSTGIVNTSAPARAGARTSTSPPFRGTIDEIRVYNKLLTGSDLTRIRNE